MKNLILMIISVMVVLIDVPCLAGAPAAQTTQTADMPCGARNFEKKTDHGYFSHGLDRKAWTTIGKSLQMSYTMPHLVGYRFALFNYAATNAGGFADCDYFHVGNVISEK